MPTTSPPLPASPSAHPLHNRLAAVMAHTSRYSFRGPARLAADLGVPRSTVMRLLSLQSHPAVGLALAIVARLEAEVGTRLDVRELFSFDGSYPTASVCDLVGCRGCLPEEVYDRNEVVRPEYRDLRPGRWPQQFSPRWENSS